MAKNRDSSKAFKKGGYKTRKRPKGISRAGLPKIYPPNVKSSIVSIGN